MIRILLNPRDGRYYRCLVDPNTGRTLRVLGPAVLSEVNPGNTGHTLEPGVEESMQGYLQGTLPDADIVGFRGEGVVPGGEQVRYNERAAALQGSLSNVPTRRPLAGAQGQNRGNSAILTFGGLTENTPPTTINSLVETPLEAGDDGEGLLVQLGMTPVISEALAYPPGPPATPPLFLTDIVATALLSWGTGGAQFNAEVDWLQGLSFVLPASFARVGVRAEATANGADQPLVKVKFDAALNYGGAGRDVGTVLRRSFRILDLNPGAANTQHIVIPPFATSFTALVGGAGGSTDGGFFTGAVDLALGLEIGLTDANGGCGYRVVANTNLANNFETQFPIPNGYRILNVRNDGLAVLRTVNIVFTIGI